MMHVREQSLYDNSTRNYHAADPQVISVLQKDQVDLLHADLSSASLSLASARVFSRSLGNTVERLPDGTLTTSPRDDGNEQPL